MDIDKQVWRAWKDTLHKLGRDLRALATSSENEFLSIGARLNDFNGRAGLISKMSSSLVESMSETELCTIIEGFRELLSRMNHYLEETEGVFENCAEILQEIHGIIGDISGHVTGFRKIAKILRILSTSTKIESSQLSQDTNGFITISEDIERLAVLIHSRFADIISNAESLRALVGKALVKMREFKIEQRGKVQTILEGTQATLESLTEKNKASSAMAYELSAESESVSRNIGQVVASMQFHDITRQQIEHVEEALDKLCREVIDDGSDPVRAVKETGVICALQKAQLMPVRETFIHAVEDIIGSLNGVSSNILDMYQDVQKIAGGEDKTSSSFLSKIESGVSLIIASLKKNAEAISELFATMGDLITTIGTMSGFVLNIEEIGSEIELIALNARVKAGNSGSKGAPLGVIAEAIQKLSLDALLQKAEISNELQRIASSAERLQMNISTRMDGQIAETDTMLKDLDPLTERLSGINEKTSPLLQEIERAGWALANDIEHAVLEIGIQERFAEAIDTAVDVLDSIIREAHDLVPGTSDDEKAEIARYLESHYTMELERNIHTSYTSTGSEKARHRGDAGGIEGVSETAFGDNVELF